MLTKTIFAATATALTLLASPPAAIASPPDNYVFGGKFDDRKVCEEERNRTAHRGVRVGPQCEYDYSNGWAGWWYWIIPG